MKLDAWLSEEHSLDAKLRVIERLCQAVNGVHDDGEALGALEPSRIEIGAEGRCDLSAAREGSPAAPYSAPDREQGPSMAAADIYAVGAIGWEMLAGRPPGASPRHLVEVRPGLDRELSNAVMACLESSGEWRPRDLTFLAQMAAARQKKKAKAPSSAPRAPLPPRRSAPRPVRRGPRRRTWPLLAALVVVMGLAFVAGRRLLAPGDDGAASSRPAATPPASAPPPSTPPSLPAVAQAPVEPAPASPAEERPTLLPPPAPEPAAEPTPTPTPPLSALPAPAPATDETRRPALRERPDPVGPAQPRRVAPLPESMPQTREPPAPSEAGPAAPGPPPVLTAVSPLEVKSPGKVLLDLHGRGFRPGHRARILPVKKVPWGMSVVGQKDVSESLITVLLELNDAVEPGEYALAVEDGLGTRTDPVVFEVTK